MNPLPDAAITFVMWYRYLWAVLRQL